MLIDYHPMVSRYNLNIRGVLHIGAHYGEEANSYGNLPVIYFEPLKKSFEILKQNVKSPNAIFENLALGNENKKIKMYVETVNKGQSSSILKPKTHLSEYPNIKFDQEETVDMIRLDEYLMDGSKYNFINIDVQGYELEVFKGSKIVLENIDYIYAEINEKELFEGCAFVKEIDDFLYVYGFRRVETKMSVNGWGDALYIKDKNKVFSTDYTKLNPQRVFNSVIIVPPDLETNGVECIRSSYISRDLHRTIWDIPNDKKIILISPYFRGNLASFIERLEQIPFTDCKTLVCGDQKESEIPFEVISIDYVGSGDSLIFNRSNFRSLNDISTGSDYHEVIIKIIKGCQGLETYAPCIRNPRNSSMKIVDNRLMTNRIRPYGKKISIILGTLNRRHLLPGLLENTIKRSPNVELVIADGGSTDGTLEYLKEEREKDSRITLIEIGHKSTYPNFMNIALSAARYEWICQWTDDSYLIQSWEDVIDRLDNSDFYLFTWKWGKKEDLNNPQWLQCVNRKGSDCNGWQLYLKEYGAGDIVVNMGIYRKQVFREIGMYYEGYKFWCADGDMSERAFSFGYKPKPLNDIQVLVHVEKHQQSGSLDEDCKTYAKCRELYRHQKLPEGIIYLNNSLKTTVFIPSTPGHFHYLEEIIQKYQNGTVKPEEIIVSLSESNRVEISKIYDLETKYPTLRFLRHVDKVEAGPNRQFAENCDGDIILYQDSDDLPSRDRVEIVKNFFESEPDIFVLNHSYRRVTEYNEMLLDQSSFKVMGPDELYKLYFPNGDINDAKLVKAYGGHIKFPVHAGVVCIRKDVLKLVKWKTWEDQVIAPKPPKEMYKGAGAEDFEFCMDCLFYFKKSAIIDAPIYFYR